MKPHKTRAPATGRTTSHCAGLRQGPLRPSWLCSPYIYPMKGRSLLILAQLDRAGSRSDMLVLRQNITQPPARKNAVRVIRRCCAIRNKRGFRARITNCAKHVLSDAVLPSWRHGPCSGSPAGGMRATARLRQRVTTRPRTQESARSSGSSMLHGSKRARHSCHVSQTH